MADLRPQILAVIRRVLASELEFRGAVDPRHELVRDLGIDSMGAVVLAVELEDRFRVRLSPEDSAAVVTVEDLIGLVERMVREDGRGAPP